MKFWLSCFAASFSISVGLFLFMGGLISMDGNYKPSPSDIFVDFGNVKNDSDIDVKERKRPKKPPTPEQPKDVQKIQVAKTDQVSKPSMKMNIPKLSLSSVDSGGPFLGAGGGASGDGEALPLVRIEPQYPRKAAMRGIQGWVVLKFDITEKGTVSNVAVLEAKPRKIFDKSAKRALLKWRFKPKVVDGKAVSQVGQKVNLEFKLNK